MDHNDIVEFISNSCNTKSDFSVRIDDLLEIMGPLTSELLKEHLAVSGIIPEVYEHDSSEEKMYAKYCDIMVHGSFQLMGMKSILCTERADYADVIGEKLNEYKIAADGKAFRLSRTALNPKDYKIEPLNGWRKKASADYACLIAPHFEFPGSNSRLYREAVLTNVTLLSYIHLLFIISNKNADSIDYTPLWNIGKGLAKRASISGSDYWDKVHNTLCECVGVNKEDWDKFVERAKQHASAQALKEAAFWEKEKEKILKMSKEELQKILLEKTRVQSNIDQIKNKARVRYKL